MLEVTCLLMLNLGMVMSDSKNIGPQVFRCVPKWLESEIFLSFFVYVCEGLSELELHA